MAELVKDLVLVSLGMGIGVVLMCIAQVSKMADEEMEEIKKENPECQFVVLSAYRDFEYAKKACDLGAFAYLLKPIEDEKLQATMTDVGKICEDQIRNEEKYDRWERLLKKDGDGFLQVVVQKYVQNRLPEEKVYYSICRS